jgi:hypothetical protein
VVCASPDYLTANGTPTTPEDLARHSVISFDSVSSPTSWSFQSGTNEATVTFRSRLSVNTIDAAIVAGLSGAGLVRVLSYQVVDFVRSKRMTIVLDSFEPPPPPVHIVYDTRNRLPLKLRAFIDFVVPPLRERLARGSVKQSNILSMAVPRAAANAGADKDRRRVSSGTARGLPAGGMATANTHESAPPRPDGHRRASLAGVVLLIAISVVADSALSAAESQCELWLRADILRSPGAMNESDAPESGLSLKG